MFKNILKSYRRTKNVVEEIRYWVDKIEQMEGLKREATMRMEKAQEYKAEETVLRCKYTIEYCNDNINMYKNILNRFVEITGQKG